LSCAGVAAPAQPFLAALLHRLFPRRPIVVVAAGPKTQERFQQDLETWLALKFEARNSKPELGDLQPSTLNPQPLFYPAWEVLPHEARLPHVDVISDRLQTLVALAAQSGISNLKSQMVVTSVTALLQRTFASEDLRQRTRTLARSDRTDPLALIEWLEAQGYEPEAQVTQKGEIALRGGILDVFPLTSPWPVRLEFFGDELESLREFDPLTQISRGEVQCITLPPAGELGILKRLVGTRSTASQTLLANGDAVERVPTAALGTLLDYLPREAIFLLCETDLLAKRADEDAAQVPPDDPFFISWEEFAQQLDQCGMTRIEAAEGEEEAVVAASDSPIFVSLDAYRPLSERPPEPQVAEAQRREFFNQLHRWLRQEYAVHVFCNNDGERQRFAEIWAEHGFGGVGQAASLSQSETTPVQRPAPLTTPAAANLNNGDRLEACPTLHLGTLSRGFICDEAKLVVVTDAEVFGRYRVQRPRRLKSAHALATRSALDIDFTELEGGDLVVHVQYGIGRYLGLKNLPTATGAAQSAIRNPQSAIECLVIEYAAANPGDEPPKLYVPVTEAHLVGKYVGVGKARPPLNTLGGTRWRKAKEQAERAVRDVAAELLAVQAARETQPGHAFPPDAPWQREFEASFIFEETPDQDQAIAQTKADMELPRPMDRLICGDVGFGKTEVAIRAAFKAVLGGKQVAVLVPTTVLAQQHFNTFRERMADYPVRIELLSRFRTRRAQQRVVEDLANGAVDIVIGTHRLIQDDVAFKELGLVVVDEEQRFGVLHKEKLKLLRTQVDVLTLSATPIPRTLYLALTGARDMSSIQTPPHDRLPVETIVTQYDERLIRDAIQRELNRGGQVFFLHNRVMTIDLMADRLRNLLPDARLVVGHGQMHADDLEEVMTQFVNGEADVLLSTTIIESGLDIPNANTIIIDRADRFGLSDLYQLRGRVGRYKHQAYAYLLLPRHARLLTDVRKRISAIRQYSTLGSGFKVAMRDLEIRGAGNLLGAEQSGHITAVGFELYCQLLKQSVAALKGEKVKPRVEVSVRLDFVETKAPGEPGDVLRVPCSVEQRAARRDILDATRDTQHACLPHHYLPEPQHRIEIYRKLAQATDKAALETLTRELRDRFGPLPPPVELLLQVAELKILAADCGVSVVEVQDDRLMLTRYGEFVMLGGKFPRLTKKGAGPRLKEIARLLSALS
jgi:transcription-repair coupling factor (superfamily II helicase)